MADQGQELRLPAPAPPRRTRPIRHQQPRSRRPPMNLTSPRRSRSERRRDDGSRRAAARPRDRRRDGTLTAMVDGTPFASPDASAGRGRRSGRSWMPSPDQDRTIAVRVEVRRAMERLHRHPPHPQARRAAARPRTRCRRLVESPRPTDAALWPRSPRAVRARRGCRRRDDRLPHRRHRNRRGPTLIDLDDLPDATR